MNPGVLLRAREPVITCEQATGPMKYKNWKLGNGPLGLHSYFLKTQFLWPLSLCPPVRELETPCMGGPGLRIYCDWTHRGLLSASATDLCSQGSPDPLINEATAEGLQNQHGSHLQTSEASAPEKILQRNPAVVNNCSLLGDEPV